MEGKKVLILDDDELLLDMYATKFKEGGFSVETAARGDAALEKIRADVPPDVVLFDMVMPGLDGIGLLEELKERPPAKRPLLIVLSNQGQESEIEKAKSLGADDYFVKANFIPSEVVAKVKAKFADVKS